jgi:hypothetical protein
MYTTHYITLGVGLQPEAAQHWMCCPVCGRGAMMDWLPSTLPHTVNTWQPFSMKMICLQILLSILAGHRERKTKSTIDKYEIYKVQVCA